MQEVAHLQCALMLRDEVGHRSWQAVTTRQFQALIDVGLKNSGTGKGIIESVVGIFNVSDLVLDEPFRRMQFANIVIERTGTD